MSLVAAVCLAVAGMYGLHPRGIALSWRLLLEREEMAFALLLLSQLAIAGACVRFLAGELGAYGRWLRNRATPADAEREGNWAVAQHVAGTPARIVRALAETSREAWYERGRIWARAQRRRPAKKRELRGLLFQKLTHKIWLGAAIVGGGEALAAYLSYRIPGHTLTPGLSMSAALVGLAIGNVLVLVSWVAGDDDEGGHAERERPVPTAPQGNRHPKRKSRPVAPRLRVGQAAKQRTLTGR